MEEETIGTNPSGSNDDDSTSALSALFRGYNFHYKVQSHMNDDETDETTEWNFMVILIRDKAIICYAKELVIFIWKYEHY